jgi:uncharacterized protein with GYD domain
MAILITTARFTADGPQGAVVAPAERVESAGRLIAGIGGTLIGCYRTSGDHDVLIIFEASSYEEAVPALDAAAAGSGVIDLRTVRVLASHETKTPLPASRTNAAIRPSEGDAAPRAAAEPGVQPPARPDATTASEMEADAKAAARILEARKKSAEDIAAGRPAPYYFATPTTPAPSRPNPACASKDDDGSAKR